MIIAPHVTAEFTCIGPYNDFPPKWLLNGKGQLDVGNCYNSNKTNTPGNGNATATLIIHGNSTQCETFNISCRIYKDSQFLYLHNTTVEIEGWLPSCHSIVIGLTILATNSILSGHPQVGFPHLKVFDTLTPQQLNGARLTFQ